VETTSRPTSTSMNERKKKKHHRQTGHGGGVGKRQQGEIVSEFLIQLIMAMLTKQQQQHQDHECVAFHSNKQSTTTHTNQKQTLPSPPPTSSSPPLQPKQQQQQQDKETEKLTLRHQAIHYLNKGTGVLDVAGGSGHVSLALVLKGIQSTVVDPRETVGRLPGRDRKHLRKALLNHQRPRSLFSSMGGNSASSSSCCSSGGGAGGADESLGDRDVAGKGKTHSMTRPNTALPSPPPIEFASLRA